MAGEFKQFLSDIEFRVAQAYDVSRNHARTYAEDMHVGMPLLTGYTISNNTPSAGYVEWSSLHIVYNGTDNAITDGNSNDTYLYWDPTVSSTTLQTSNTKPTLGASAALVFVNNSGIATVAVGATIPPAIGNASVDSAAIIAGAVGNTALASGAVQSGNIASGAVTSAALGSSSVTSAAIATGAVGSSALASGAVTNAALASGAVESGNLAAGAVDSAALGDAAVSAANLNLLSHFLY